MSRPDDAPPLEVVHAAGAALADECMVVFGSAWSNDVRWRFARAALVFLRALPAAARWRLIGWLAEGLEPTRGMKIAALGALERGDGTRDAIKEAMAEAVDAENE